MNYKNHVIFSLITTLCFHIPIAQGPEHLVNQETSPQKAIRHGLAEHKPLLGAYSAVTTSCRLGLLEIPPKKPKGK